MIIHDDTDMATVVERAVAAINEIARHVGKSDRAISAEEIGRVETAIAALQHALAIKKAHTGV
jgi:hypothetical protein